MKCLELARVSEDVELHKSQVLRFFEEFRKSFPTLRPQVRRMKELCQMANQSERFYRVISEDQWLRTTISLKDPVDTFDSEAITIHSNVLPSRAYLTSLKRTMPATCSAHQFFPISLLEEILEDPGLKRVLESHTTEPCQPPDFHLLERKIWKWMEMREECVLVKQLQERCQKEPNEDMSSWVRFWCIVPEDIESVKELGAGSEGSVWKVLWCRGTFARKTFMHWATFEKELDVALAISHPNIVHYFGFALDDGHGCSLFMEFLDNDLYKYIFDHASRITGHYDLPFAYEVSLDVLLQIAQGMEHLHEKNLVYGDLKPLNILMGCYDLIESDRQYYLVKIADFGNARRVSSYKCEGGTFIYTAPEILKWRQCRRQYESRENFNLKLEQPQKIDVYSFGIVAFHVLTGLLEPYEGIPNSEIKKRVMEGSFGPSFAALHEDRYPRSLLDLVRRCWCADPVQRPPFSEICSTIQSLMDTHIKPQHDLILTFKDLSMKACGKRPSPPQADEVDNSAKRNRVPEVNVIVSASHASTSGP